MSQPKSVEGYEKYMTSSIENKIFKCFSQLLTVNIRVQSNTNKPQVATG